jgi:hypothetical protein
MKEERCLNCGYCPHCGRSDYSRHAQPWPTLPPWWYSPQPYTITWSNDSTNADANTSNTYITETYHGD